ncbi:hypothetical protein WG66_001632 [Moniliophthora roreri]|nr:hypothetical protein WG66_001632 [Moniliophthora roreri]
MKDFVEQQRRLEPQASPAMMSSFLETMRGFFGTLGWLPGPQAMAETPASNPNDHESNSNSDNEDVAMNHSPREASSDAPSASASAQSPGVPPTSVRVPPTPKSPVPRKRKATTSSHDGDHPQAGRSPSKVIRTRSMTSIHSPSSSSTPSSNTRKGKRKARKCDDGLPDS